MSLITGVSDAYHRIGDTLINLITGLGTPKDPRTSSLFLFRELDRNVLEQMYRSDWLARRLVDLPAQDATREWRQWTAARPQLEKIDALEKKLDIKKKVRQALTRARLYGGGALVLGVDQGKPGDELVLDDVGLNDLQFVVVVNRYELMAGPRIYNVDSPYYTRPEYYTVSTPMFGFYGESGGSFPFNPSGNPKPLSDPAQRVQGSYGMVQMHPSRVIEFAGNELPDWRLIPLGGGWGDSILQTVDDALRDFAMITGGLASMINDMKMDVVRVPDLTRKLSTSEMTQRTLSRFAMANAAKSSINTLLLDKEEEWERITTSFGSTPELIKVAMTIACGAGGIPESRVLGSSPGKGLADQGGSGGEIDIRNYFDDIASKQRGEYKPALNSLDRCIQQSALGKYDPSIDYVWNPLYQPTASELATMALAKAQTTQVYVTTGLINEDALREAVVSQLTEDKVYPGLEDAIDEFGSEPEEPEEPPAVTPPPGMMPKGQFDPNPFHMLRAQAASAAGQPIRVPPNRPQALPKPKPGKTAAKDALAAIYRLQDFNPNHDERGRFAASAVGGSAAYQKAFAELAKQFPEEVEAHLSRIAAQAGGGESGDGEDEPAHEKAAKEAMEHWQALANGVKAIGQMRGVKVDMEAGVLAAVGTAVSTAAQAGAFHAGGVVAQAAKDTVADQIKEVIGGLGVGAVAGALGGGLVGALGASAAAYAVEKVADYFGFTPTMAQHMLVVAGRAASGYMNHSVMPMLNEVEGVLKDMRGAAVERGVSEFHHAHGYSDAAASEDIDKVLALIAEVRAAVARLDAVLAVWETKNFGKKES